MRRVQFTFLRGAAARTLAVVLLVALTSGALHLLRSQLNTPLVALLYLLPVVLGTTLWGLGAGILASFSAFLAFNYYFIEPYYTFVVHQTQDLLALVVFLGVAIVISQLVGRAQANLAAAQAREREATQLYELSAALAGLRSEEAIARAVAERVHETAQAQAVEVALHASLSDHILSVSVPAGQPRPDRPPRVFPLTTARGQSGELRLWLAEPSNSPVQGRLVQTMASQAALALEQVRLTKTETQAKILEESDRLKSALLSSVSHELRTPLATIKAAVTSLRGGEAGWDTPAREDLLSLMEEDVDHLNRLVGNLLDMSRIEAGALHPQRQWNSLADILGGTLARMRHAAEGHRLEVGFPEDLPLVPADHAQLDRVFTNLISNSLKYAPSGTTIRIAASVEGDQVLRVQVSNQGPPVAEEHLDHIFDKFYRVTAADRVTGTGLGLSICKGIIEAHGGRIWAENLADGFAFNFTLPLTWDGAGPPSVPPEPEEA